MSDLPVNQRLDDDSFGEQRRGVLAQWRTGQDVDFNEALAYQKSIPWCRRMTVRIEEAAEKGEVLTMPVAGVPLVDEHIELLRALQDEGGADLLPTTIDTQTRNLAFEEGEKLLAESARLGHSVMNGFPLVNHGVATARRVTESFRLPMDVRTQTVDTRLCAEVGFAGGYTGITGGAMTAFTCYSRDATLEDAIRCFQYVDRLVALYGTQGCPLQRELQGYNMGVVHPPSLGIVYVLIDCLLGATQGAKSIVLTRHQQGSILQDIAASRVQIEMANEYLNKFGFKDVRVYPMLREWIGPFPINPAQGYSVITVGAVIGVLAGASYIVLKTVDEGVALPRKEANVAATQNVKATITMLTGQRYPDSPQLSEEMDVLRREIRAMMDKVLEVGDGDVARGACLAMRYGILDAPFAPNLYVKDKVRPVRDLTGAIRFAEFGNLPLPDDIKKYHRQRIEERLAREGCEGGLDLVVRDIMEGALRVEC